MTTTISPRRLLGLLAVTAAVALPVAVQPPVHTRPSTSARSCRRPLSPRPRVTFTSTNESDDGRGNYTCFDNGAADLHGDVSIHQDPSRATLDDLLALLGDGQPVQGIGDQAYVSPVGMAVQLGDRLLWVGSGTGGSGTGSASSYEALAKAVIAALK